MISVFAGWPDQGKGLLGAMLASDLTKPTPVAPDTACNMNVLYSAIEDAAGIMTKPRLEAAGADLSKVYVGGFRIPDQIDQLADFVFANKIGCVIIDPFASHLSHGYPRHGDKVRDALQPVKELCEAADMAVVIVEHALKRVPASGHILQAIGGVGLGQMARAAYVLGVNPTDQDQRVLAVAKLNIAEKPKAMAFDVEVDELEVYSRAEKRMVLADVPYLVFSEELDAFDPMSLFKKQGGALPGKIGRPPEKRAAAAEWLTHYLLSKGGPVPAGTVQEDAKQIAMSGRTLRRAADDMAVVRNPPGGGPKCTWSLPDRVWQAFGLTPPGQSADVPDTGTDWDTALGDLLDGGEPDE
jgi:hypothetical protein